MIMGDAEPAMAALQPGSTLLQPSPMRASAADSRDGKPSGCSGAKQLNKFKSFLGRIQGHQDPSEDEHMAKNRQQRINTLIDNLVNHGQIDTFLSDLHAVYPISDSEMTTILPVIKAGLPLLKAEIKNSMDNKGERSFGNDQAATEEQRYPGSYERRRGERGDRGERGERHNRVEVEPAIKRPYPGDAAAASTNGQHGMPLVPKAELHDTIQQVLYQLQALTEQLGQLMYALRASDSIPPSYHGGEAVRGGHAPRAPPPQAAIAVPIGAGYPPEHRTSRHPSAKPGSPPLPSATSSRTPHYPLQPSHPGRMPGHVAIPVSAYSAPPGHPPTATINPVVEVKPSASSKQPGGSSSSSRPKESSKSSKHRDDSVAKKHRSAPAETCWACGAPASETCSRCKKARYCGAMCQRVDWNEQHHRDCKSPPAKTANGQ